MNMMTKLWTAWRTHRYWNRARDEGKHLVRESRRILKRRSYRIPQTVADEIGLAVAEVESAAKGDDFERMREAIAALDERMDKHLAFARKSTAREYAESIGVALAVALLLRAFVVEAFQIPSGSMIPTLEIGDHIFVSKFAYGIGIPFTNKKVVEFSDPQRGDIIVFRYPPILPRTSSSAWWGCPVIRSSFATTRSSSTVNPWFVSVSPPNVDTTKVAAPRRRAIASCGSRALAVRPIRSTRTPTSPRRTGGPAWCPRVASS